MATTPLLKHRFDDRIVNIFLASERAYWCKQFGCTEMQLQTAVSIVGSQAAAVEKHAKGWAY